MYLTDYTPSRLRTVLNQFQYNQLLQRQIQLQILMFYTYDFDQEKPMPTLTEYLHQTK